MVKKSSYFMGLRITTNNAQMVDNSSPIDKEVSPRYRSRVFNSPIDSFNSDAVDNTAFGYQKPQ